MASHHAIAFNAEERGGFLSAPIVGVRTARM
jgi:hypothetical protein